MSRCTLSTAHDHLAVELLRLDLMLARRIAELRSDGVYSDDPMRGLFVGNEQADCLLARKAPSHDARTHIDALTGRIDAQRRSIDSAVARAQSHGVRLPLTELAERFALDELERDCLLIALAPEFDSRYASLYAYAHNDVTRKRASVELCLALTHAPMTVDVRSRFTPNARLFAWRLVEMEDGGKRTATALLGRALAVPERVVAHALGADAHGTSDEALTTVVDTRRIDTAAFSPADCLMPAFRHAREWIAQEPLIVRLIAPRGSGKRAVAQRLAARPVAVMDLRAAVDAGLDVPAFIVPFLRDARLADATPYFAGMDRCCRHDQWSAWRHAVHTAIARARHECGLSVFMSGETDFAFGAEESDDHITLRLPEAGIAERAVCWGAMPGVEPALAAELAGKFALSPPQILAASREARCLARLRGGAAAMPTSSEWHAAAREHSSRGLEQLAQKIEPVATWADLVLPPRTAIQLREVCASVRCRAMVHSTWGFGKRLALARGLNVLFAGASGTGKTMSAQVLAAELELDLYKIDLATVVSKYIGDTEKNLSQIFAAARSSNAVLFFDEADALFGRRSEVKDAHDRFANIEVAYLLQKMEEHPGIVILATNLSRNIDDAFARRMQHVVDFPMPNAALRHRLWRRMFPACAPVAADVDFEFLAGQFDLAGGHIRNVALAAAFAAAQDNRPIAMPDLIVGTAREFHKLGRMPGRTEFGAYYELVRDAV